jgi:hypothetical protein
MGALTANNDHSGCPSYMNFKNSVMPNWGELFFDSSFIVPIQGLCPASAELASRREALGRSASVIRQCHSWLPYYCELLENTQQGTLFQPE